MAYTRYSIYAVARKKTYWPNSNQLLQCNVLFFCPTPYPDDADADDDDDDDDDDATASITKQQQPVQGLNAVRSQSYVPCRHISATLWPTS